MQGEEIDNMDDLIREASNSHHPVYDDKAWERMEVLLDQHLPVKKRKKRPGLLLILLLMLTGSIYLAINYREDFVTQTVSKTVKQTIVPQNQVQSGNLSGANTINSLPAPGNQQSAAISGKNKKNGGPVSGKALQSARFNIRTGEFVDNDSILPAEVLDPEAGSLGDNYPNMRSNEDTVRYAAVDDDTTRNTPLSKNTDSGHHIVFEPRGAEPGKMPSTFPGDKKVERGNRKGFGNNFAVTLSAGPDRSFVSSGHGSTTRLNYGAGVSYIIANRVTLISGVYAARKTYAARAAAYRPPAGYWTYNADLQSVRADCDIIEIPLFATYNFKQSKRHHWFAGLGFSTLVMKRETYDYLYKDGWGQMRNKVWTLNNGGNQFFSVLTFSGGYQYRINHHLSISAAPYLKLPLQGIGFGKIRINSGGLLFTASVQPFARSK